MCLFWCDRSHINFDMTDHIFIWYDRRQVNLDITNSNKSYKGQANCKGIMHVCQDDCNENGSQNIISCCFTLENLTFAVIAQYYHI